MLAPEDVRARLQDETVDYDCELGIGSKFTENLHIKVMVEKEKYEDAVRWMKDLLYGVKFDSER